MNNKLVISAIINILLGIGIIYLLLFNNQPIVDVSHYKHKIDSLQAIINVNNHKIDSLTKIETKKQVDIDNLKCQLSDLSNKNKNLKKKYDAEIALINSMSDDDIVKLFTETFK